MDAYANARVDVVYNGGVLDHLTGFERQDGRFERRDTKLETAVDARFDKMDAKIDRMDAKFESKLEATSTRRFAVWRAVISSAATIAVAVLMGSNRIRPSYHCPC